ncbi:MAG: citrate lyase acyl carrier protein [Firmicutes bacterium]|nr:citrate lyase acyl carrier protein [Bacillota bacterium]MBR4020720.1 citrate lyase acyl carrier protein [Bacillota bacterium]
MKEKAWAGTMESSDIYVEVEPLATGSGIDLTVNSVVYAQFGDAIEKTIMETLESLAIDDMKVVANDRGAVDCTIKARVETAVRRLKEEA